jgi:hypothetical protein
MNKKIYLSLHSQIKKCENSSVGRARPCQGRGREFESRFSLQLEICFLQTDFYFENNRPGGGIGRHAGLKIL